jgi:hypothetical protein
MNQTREIKQLFHTAVSLFRLAETGYRKLSSSQVQLKVEDISRAFEAETFANNEKRNNRDSHLLRDNVTPVNRWLSPG